MPPINENTTLASNVISCWRFSCWLRWPKLLPLWSVPPPQLSPPALENTWGFGLKQHLHQFWRGQAGGRKLCLGASLVRVCPSALKSCCLDKNWIKRIINTYWIRVARYRKTNKKCCMGHTYTKNYSLFIWHSSWTGHPVFYLVVWPWTDTPDVKETVA